MTITEITFTRKCNTGNFESFDLAATARLEANDSPTVAAETLQTYVDTLCVERAERQKAKPWSKRAVQGTFRDPDYLDQSTPGGSH